MLGVGLVLLGVGPAFANPVITSTPASGDTYGVGETITTQLNHGQVFGVSGGSFTTIYMNITIGANTRRAYISHGYTVRRTNSQFSYTVQAGDVDADGISIPQNSIGGPAYRSFGFGNVNRDHAAVTNQAGHKVDGSVAKIVSSNRAWLTWGNLNNATLDVELNGQTYGSSVAASHFTVSATPAIAGLSITGASATSGGTTATVTLSYSGSTALSGDRAFRVQVAPGAHSGGLTVTSTNQAIVGATGSQPRTTLSLSPASIAENGGVATVRATLSKTPVRPVTVTVAAAPVSPAVAGDFTVSTANTLTIPAGATASTGTVTVTAVNNNVVAAAKTVTVSGSVTPSGGAVDPASVTLTIPDDEPYVKVVLNPTSIAEGSVSTVTATLTTAASAAVTVALQAVAGDTNTVAADFTLSAQGVIIPAGATVNTGLVTITAVDNMVHRPFSKSVTVRTAPQSVRTTAPVGRRLADLSATLTITEDDVLAVTLVPDPATVAENGGLSTVTATLSYPTTEAATVTVAAAAGTGAAAGDFTQAGTTLTIAANATTSTGLVTVTSMDDDIYQGSAGSGVTISGTVAGGNGAPNPAAATLTRTDDETVLPTVALALSEPDATMADTISENGGVSTVTATLSGKAGEAVTVTVAAAAVASTGAVVGDFSLSGTTLTIAARATTSTGLVTVTGVDNNVDAADKSVTVSGTSAGGTGVADPADATLTLTDDDDATATLVLNPASILESGEVSTVTARLSHPTTEAATLTVAAAPVSPADAMDFNLSSTTTLTIAAGDTTSTGLVTVTAVDNNDAEGRKRVTVSATAAGGRGLAAPADATLILRDDEFGLAVSAVSGGPVTETGGQATFTVRLNTEPSAAVTVAVTSQDPGEGTVDPSSLTFTTATGPGGWDTAQTVTATGVQDSTDDADVTWQVRLDPASGDSDYNGLANVDVDVTTTDGDGPPGVTLSLDPSSVSENGGVATVTARLSHASGAATTLTVAAVSGAFTVGTDATIVIAAGETTAASDTVLVTAVDNVTDAPDRTATVTAAVTNDRAAADSTTMAVTDATLTLTDDDPATSAVLFLAPSSVSENGGVASVAVVLSRPSSEPSTVTVTAVVGDYTVAANATLTVAAGFTVTTDTATVTAVDDDLHQGSAGRSVTVAATLTNGQGAGAVTGGSLTLSDDETLPVASLALDPASISENGGVSTVTAALSGKSSEAVTVTVGAAAGTGATAADFTLSTAATLTIASGSTTSAGVVTVTAVDDTGTTGSIQVTVSGTAAGGNSVANPADRTLTITDDDTPQTTLALDPASIAENGGVATVTATLDRTSSVAVTVTVGAAAGTGAVAGDFSLSTARTLTFAANATTSAGLVTVTAVNNTTDAPDKSVTVSGTAADSLNLTNDPPDVTLAIADDDAGPGVTLAVNPTSIAEPNGVSTVTATLSHPSSEPSTVTVTAVSGAYTAGADATIVIAAGATTAASDTALIRVVDDDLHHGNAGRSATVTGTLTNGQGAGAVTGASLTITDDETLPEASLVFSSGTISENGGIATVTASLSGLSGKSSEATTVTVTVTAVATSGAVAGDFTQSGTTLTVAAGATTSTGLVTVTAVDNNLDIGTAQKQLRVSGTAAGGNGIQNPTLSLLLIDDDDATEATLVLDPSTILENGGISTVTARLSHPTTQAATLTVAAAAGTNADMNDFTLSSTTTLTIAANATTSTGLVTVAAQNNNDVEGNKQVTVSATAAGGRGVSNPSNATLVIRDDEFGLSESAVMGQATEAGGQATFTVRLNTQPSAAVTVSVTSRDASEGTVSPPTLTFAPGAWNTPQTVTVTGVQDTIDDGDVTWQVRLDPSSGDSDYNAVTDVDQDVTTTDDDGAPTVTMALSPSSVAEMGGVATVTARLSHGSGTATTLTVAAVSGSFTVGTDATIVIAAEATAAPTDTVLVTAVDNTTDEPNRTATVTATATNARAAADSTTMTVTGATLTLEDDEAAPGATLSVMPASVSENGGVATVTATLSGLSSEPSTVTVQAVAGAYAAGTDATIVIAAGATTAASDTALVTAVDDDVYQGSAGRSVTVTAALTNGQGAGAVTGASLTLADDDALPTAALALGPASISENGGVSTVRATLSRPTTVATTLTVAAVASTGAVAGDFSLSTAATLTIAAGATTSTGAVTVRGNDNAVDAANKSVTVSATATGGNGVAAPSAVTLTLTDDEATATATLALAPAAILENGEVSTVTAVLSHPTTEATTLTVSAAPVSPAVAGDFTLSSTNTLTIAAGATTSAGLVTITSVDNTAAEGRKRVTVSATAAGGRGVAAPSNATLTIRDDEFGLSESAVSGQATEAGGQATFTVALQTQPSAAVTVAVTSLDTSEGTVAPSSLVFTTGNWETAQTVTVTGVKDNLHDGPQPWRVRLAPSSGDADYDSLDPVDVNGTTTDDEPPEVTLALAPSSISEDGGVATVTAVKEHPSVAETVVTVTAAPVAPAVAGDFTLSAAATLTIAAGATTSAGLVTVTATDNAVDALDKTVTVSGTAVNAQATMDGEVVDVEDAMPPLTIVNDDEKGLLFLAAGTTASVVEVASGSRDASYTVALTSQPTGPVTVAVAAAGDVRAAPSSLTFTMADWKRAQAVTVTVGSSVGADGYAAALSVAHEASGGDYRDVTGAMSVSVAGATRIALDRIEAGAGPVRFGIEGRVVTVTVEPGLPAGIEFDPKGVGTGPMLALRSSSPQVAAGVLERAERAGFLGLAAGSRTVVDFEVPGPVPPSGLRICLPVSQALVEAAARVAGREPLLLRYDEDREVWEEAVPGGSSLETEGPQPRVCAAGVTSFSLFTTDYKDTLPSFAEDFPEALSWTVDEEIAPPPLPKAEGGDGIIDYTLTPALPDGVERNGVRLSGAPTAEMAVTDYTWTATDDDGQSATLEFTIEVIPALAAARERLAAVNRSVLPELSRAMWGSALDAIGARLEGGPGGGGSGGGAMEQGLAAAADFLRSKGEALEDGEGSWRELVGGESFALALGGDADGEGAGGGSAVVMWGGGDWRDLSREDGLLSWSGKLFSAHVGADVALGGGVMGGVAVSRFESAIDYTDRSDEGAGAIEGDHEHRMVAVHPYLGWSGVGGERLWAALGYGRGEVRIADTGIFDRYEWQESDGRLVAGALGGAVPVYGDGDSSVEMRASAEATRYVLADNGEAIAGVSVSTRRLRLATVGSWNWALRGGRLLEPSLEAGLRWDDGDGATGVGVELGGGLAWSDAAAGLSASFSGRSLVAHGSDVEEWGASGSLHMDAGGDGRGLSLSLSPAWGASGSGLARLWEEGMASRDGVGGEGGGRLEGELGYGLAAWGEAGTLTPYGGLALGSGERRYSLGQRLALGTALGLKIEATRSEHPTTSHGLALELRMNW